jgi:hypothetical protein
VSFITIYVDDCLHSHNSEKLREELYKGIEKHGLLEYTVQKLSKEVPISFLGMSISRCRDNTIFVSQPGYTEEILKEYNIDSFKKCPHTDELYKEDIDSPPVDNTDYLSKLMKLYYLSSRTRPDIALACSVLASKNHNPTEFDMKKVLHIYSYLNYTKGFGININCNSMHLHCFFDAGWAVYSNSRSQSGWLFTLGHMGVPIFWKSLKQKLIGRSSTEAELICLFDGIDHLLWLKRVLLFFGYNQNIINVYQDNTSTITIAHMGKGSSAGHTRYINLRYFYLKDLIDAGIISMKYLPTANMIADFFASPRTGKEFWEWVAVLMSRTPDEN